MSSTRYTGEKSPFGFKRDSREPASISRSSEIVCQRVQLPRQLLEVSRRSFAEAIDLTSI
jgi:hypothetical protein